MWYANLQFLVAAVAIFTVGWIARGYFNKFINFIKRKRND